MILAGSMARISYFGCLSLAFFASRVFLFSFTDVLGDLLSIGVHDERLSLMFRLEIVGEAVESSFDIRARRRPISSSSSLRPVHCSHVDGNVEGHRHLSSRSHNEWSRVSDKESTVKQTNFEVLKFEEEFIPCLDLFVDRSVHLVLSFEVL